MYLDVFWGPGMLEVCLIGPPKGILGPGVRRKKEEEEKEEKRKKREERGEEKEEKGLQTRFEVP